MTGPSAEATPPSRPRPVRRAPTDLPFTFPDRGLVKALVAEREEPAWLRDDRMEAFKAFESLPIETNPLYTTYIDLRPADLTEARPYVRTATEPAGTSALPEGTSGVIELREDGLAGLRLDSETAAQGVTIETFEASLRRDPNGLRADLEGATTLPADDKLAQLTRGFWSQGVRLVVPDGVRLERPILIRWAMGAPGRALLSRTLVRLGEDAEAAIVEELDASQPYGGGRQSFFAGTTEAVLGRGANLSLASLQNFSPGQVAFQHRTSSVGQQASLHWALAQLGGRLVKSRVDNRLVGQGSSVEQVEIVFGGGDQVFDLTSYTRHMGRNTTGNLLSKGALRDAARSYMKGLITIEKSAVGTDSFLGEFGMNLSKKARSVTIPSLEIDQPDCRRAAHSSAVGPIDETQLFYLESRGIPPDEARKFIVLGFLEPVVARVPLADAQDRLRDLLEAKWAAPSETAAA